MSSAFDAILNAGVSLLETLSGDSFRHAGATYTGNFRTGNSLEQAEAGSFSMHGGQTRTVLILHVARSQFSAVPYSWKNQKISRETPTPAEYTVAAVNTDDPNIYAFILIGTNNPANG